MVLSEMITTQPVRYGQFPDPAALASKVQKSGTDQSLNSYHEYLYINYYI